MSNLEGKEQLLLQIIPLIVFKEHTLMSLKKSSGLSLLKTKLDTIRETKEF